MTKLFFTLFFILIITPIIHPSNCNISFEKFQNGYNIENGWYKAIVKYANYSTGKNATYALNVKVEYNKVVMIDFDDGGSVHTGYNNEGYTYSGGILYCEKDYNGNITAATATVTISDSNGIRNFNIRIE